MDSPLRDLAPETSRYPEDLAENLRLVEKLAPIHCAGCGGYHLARARRRLQPGSAHALDRPDIVGMVRDDLTRRGQAAGAPGILIAGSGDTNLLSICADAGALCDLPPSAISFTIIDRCRTPLELCEAFGRRHGFTVHTQRMEMGGAGPAFSADLILVHSLLRFVPAAMHLDTMRQLRGWLRPGGAIIFSHRLMEVEPGLTGPEYRSADQLIDLLDRAGLRVAAQRQQREEVAAPGRDLPRHRFLALLQTIA